MARFIQGGDLAFNALTLAPMHQNTYNYIASSLQSFGAGLNSFGQQFFAQASSTFNALNDAEAMRKARAILNMAGNIGQGNYIQEFWETSQVQNAQSEMQRWVMACPDIRTLYHRQLCNGYAGSYVDMDPGMVGAAQYDYRQVMNGVVDVQEDGYKFTTWLEPQREGDVRLGIDQKQDILHSWRTVQAAIASGDDPTSIWNEKL